MHNKTRSNSYVSGKCEGTDSHRRSDILHSRVRTIPQSIDHVELSVCSATVLCAVINIWTKHPPPKKKKKAKTPRVKQGSSSCAFQFGRGQEFLSVEGAAELSFSCVKGEVGCCRRRHRRIYDDRDLVSSGFVKEETTHRQLLRTK